MAAVQWKAGAQKGRMDMDEKLLVAALTKFAAGVVVLGTLLFLPAGTLLSGAMYLRKRQKNKTQQEPYTEFLFPTIYLKFHIPDARTACGRVSLRNVNLTGWNPARMMLCCGDVQLWMEPRLLMTDLSFFGENTKKVRGPKKRKNSG